MLLFLLSVRLLYRGFVGRGRESSGFILALPGCFLLSLVVACIVSNLVIRSRRITKKEGRFAGAGEGCLQQFERR